MPAQGPGGGPRTGRGRKGRVQVGAEREQGRSQVEGAGAELLQRIHEAVASSDSAAGGPQPNVHSKYLYFSLAELILVSGVAS